MIFSKSNIFFLMCVYNVYKCMRGTRYNSKSSLPERGFNEEKNACLSGGKSLLISNHSCMALFFSNFY